jgi:hypothetical protein
MKVVVFTVFILILLSSISAQEARKIGGLPNSSCADITISSHYFFEEIKKQQGSKGYVIVYNGKLVLPLYNSENKTVYPHRNEAKSEIENIKARIKFFRFDKTRLVFIEGGLREYFTIEYWIVPANAKPPIPSPTLKTMKYRKGKSYRICEVF